jgi:hypothetical protein
LTSAASYRYLGPRFPVASLVSSWGVRRPARLEPVMCATSPFNIRVLVVDDDPDIATLSDRAPHTKTSESVTTCAPRWNENSAELAQ